MTDYTVTLYRIYDKTDKKYPINRNRNNSWYHKMGHAQRALKSWNVKHPDHKFVIHTYTATLVMPQG